MLQSFKSGRSSSLPDRKTFGRPVKQIAEHGGRLRVMPDKTQSEHNESALSLNGAVTCSRLDIRPSSKLEDDHVRPGFSCNALRRHCGRKKLPPVEIATSDNRAYISTMAADKRPSGTHNPNQNSLQRWATEGGAEKGVHQRSPRAARAKKKQPAKAAKKKWRRQGRQRVIGAP